VPEDDAQPKQRLRVFLDYWNFQLSLNERTTSQLKLDWIALPVWMTNRADEVLVNAGESPGRYMGGVAYASYDAWKPDDKKLKSWLENIVTRAPGMKVVTKERKPKSPPKCQACHREISVCPHCSEPIRRMGEKGIDTGLVTDLLKQAWEDAFDTAVLVSTDADFIPAVEFVQEKGKRVIQAGFPPDGMELRKACWASVDLAAVIDLMPLRE